MIKILCLNSFKKEFDKDTKNVAFLDNFYQKKRIKKYSKINTCKEILKITYPHYLINFFFKKKFSFLCYIYGILYTIKIKNLTQKVI